MLTLLSNPTQIVTVSTEGKNYKRGSELQNVSIVTQHSIIIEDGIIKDIIPESSVQEYSFDSIIDLSNKVILPGLIDCHTHTIFAGSRSEELRMKLAGLSYEEIAKQGGGINKTVQAVRSISLSDLVELSKPKINYAIKRGITSLEIKSGYGLSFDDEIKLLQAIKKLNEIFAIDIIPTFLGAHTFPPEYKNNKDAYIDLIINKMLPYIAENKLATFCDAFCEKTAFSPEQIDMIFNKATSLGFKLKIHTDQFNSIGGIDLGLRHYVQSMDHLEVINDRDIRKISKSNSACVLLPGVSYFLQYGYAPARELIKNNAIVAISSDYNPGSCNIADLHLIMNLAAFEMNMSIEEIMSAVTINAAKALNINNELGSIEPGKRADFAVFNTQDYSDIIYNIGKNLNCMTIKNGKIIYQKGL